MASRSVFFAAIPPGLNEPISVSTGVTGLTPYGHGGNLQVGEVTIVVLRNI